MTSTATVAHRFPALAPLAVGAVAGLSVGALLVADPNEAGHYPTCPFLAVTGLQCPGCGALRAIHALLHGDVAAAAGFNVLVVLMLPVLAWAWSSWTVSSLGGRPRVPTLPPAASYSIAGVLVAFWVLRNTPVLELLAA